MEGKYCILCMFTGSPRDYLFKHDSWWTGQDGSLTHERSKHNTDAPNTQWCWKDIDSPWVSFWCWRHLLTLFWLLTGRSAAEMPPKHTNHRKVLSCLLSLPAAGVRVWTLAGRPAWCQYHTSSPWHTPAPVRRPKQETAVAQCRVNLWKNCLFHSNYIKVIM